MPTPFRVIAHRGASASAPENTLPAFERAIAFGAQEIEFDVRLSADGEIIVFHDDALDRKTNRQGRVRNHDAKTILRTDIGSWFDQRQPEPDERFAGTTISSLDQVLSRIGSRVRYHIEIKGWEDWLPLQLLRKIDDHGLRDRVTITSFSMRPLVQMRQLSKTVPICFLLRDAADAIRSAEFRPELEGASAAEVHDYWIDAAARAGFQQVGIRAADLQPRTVARATDRDLEIRAWGVGSAEDLLHVARLGAVGATVDWPDRAIEILNRSELGV